MSKTSPLVSVVIAVKDGERLIARAIESVLAQTYANHEIVVVDGHSSDRSAEIAGSYDGVRCIAQDGTGLAGAWNQGVAASRGELIAFLDSDDRWLPEKLEAQVERLAQEPGLAGVIARARFTIEPGDSPPPGFRPELLDGEYDAPMPGALLARREVFERIGDFDTNYQLAPDVDWFARAKDAGLHFEPLPMLVINKAVHADNLSHSDFDLYSREIVRALRDSAARQGSR